MRLSYTTRGEKFWKILIRRENITMIEETSFMTWLLGWPSLACQRLTLLGDEITKFKATLEFLLTSEAEAALDNQLDEVEVEVDNNREKLIVLKLEIMKWPLAPTTPWRRILLVS